MQLEMFDALDAEVAAVKAIDDAARLEAEAASREMYNQPVKCPDCGEMSRNSYLLSTNHATYYNGMCGMHYSHNSWAQMDGLRAETSAIWLSEHGFLLEAGVRL